ncbi:DNA polymerase Y family protein [Saccharopolyspora rhizosphaerae]|uniref:DNA polymerase Y family protein n=1 Tax=Saccharopolyspora rhizosphaerae TaxID=2492662 RepID=A0A3R8PY28_9PSEU|nr:DNA polymerase Y family protein [Saccharopolyspora rhizosphaerae]RRO12854.1 DNA polymerase Y family protein [Saccharopolyspora rhizosphaerae]
MSDVPARRIVVWCPDWPVVAAARAAELEPLVPAAVFAANRVVACSATARESGVRRGMRRREAQGRCPELVVCEHDPARDVRLFESVVVAVEELVPGVEVVRPGLVAVPARGPARYFRGEVTAAEKLVDEIDAQTGVECRIGVADGLFAAILAARHTRHVEPGGSRDFLAPLPIEEVEQLADRLGQKQAAEQPELVDLLRRLGIRTLGEFAALDSSDVATRFGQAALLAHRAAGGREERPVKRRRPPPELVVTEELDPPVDRVDRAAFVAKVLADELHAKLGDLGLACTRLGISARTENGEELHRTWRCAEPLTPAATADRVRWQLDGWLNGRTRGDRPTAGLDELSLRPEEVVGAGGLQLDLLSSATGEAAARAGRAFARVQGMLGPEAVLTGVLGGGRDPRDQVRFVPWGDERRSALPADPPWPGRIPAPSPTVVPGDPWPVRVLDESGEPVWITARTGLSAAPHRVEVGGGRSRAVAGWAGPWPLAERWWVDLLAGGPGQTAPEAQAPPRAQVRLQVVLGADDSAEEGADDEVALLLVHERGDWWVQGAYR